MDETEDEAEERERKSHQLVDKESNTINYKNLRPTDIPTNKLVGVPPLASNKVKIQFAALEAEIVQATNKYLEKECDSKGTPKENNLTKELKGGVNELLAMIKEDKIVTKTDKSDRLCLNTLPNYIAMAEPHISQDKVVNKEELVANERLLNGHTYQLCRILGVCTAWDDGKKVKSAMTNKNLPPPCLKLSVKDHKEIQPGQPIQPAEVTTIWRCRLKT